MVNYFHQNRTKEDFKLISGFLSQAVDILKSCGKNHWICVKYSLICRLRRKRIVVIQIDELEYDLAFDKNLFVLE